MLTCFYPLYYRFGVVSGWAGRVVGIDVWEGTSGTSVDVPGVGLKMVSVLNW